MDLGNHCLTLCTIVPGLFCITHRWLNYTWKNILKKIIVFLSECFAVPVRRNWWCIGSSFNCLNWEMYPGQQTKDAPCDSYTSGDKCEGSTAGNFHGSEHHRAACCWYLCLFYVLHDYISKICFEILCIHFTTVGMSVFFMSCMIMSVKFICFESRIISLLSARHNTLLNIRVSWLELLLHIYYLPGLNICLEICCFRETFFLPCR
jgi:hypothetical protein